MIYISFDIGVKNLAICILNNTDDMVYIIDWDIICLADKKKSLKGANNISEVLFPVLDAVIGKLESINIKYIDKVIIENQPSNLNGIMKTIQFMIYSYFDLLRHWDRTIGEVILINPSYKLQNHSYTPPLSNIDKMSRNEKYKLNKKNSIDICQYYIKDDERLKGYFNSHKKKDDLADTCLQTISYIRKKGCSIEFVKLNDINLLS